MFRPVVVLLLIGLVFAGCGSDESSNEGADTTSTDAGASTGAVTRPEGAPAAQPFGPPPTKESIEEAQARIDEAVASGDCKEINALNPLSRPTLATEQRCDYLKRIALFEEPEAESYGDLAAVIDYPLGERIYSAVLLRDADGLFHLALLDPFRSSPTVGTKFDKQFDEVAEQTFEALRDRDCDAYLESVSRLIGTGATASDKKICELFDENPISAALEANPDTKLESIGGSSQFAFYGLDFPSGYVTLLFTATPSDLPEGLPEQLTGVPENAPEVGYVSFYRTNFDESPEEDGG